MYDDYESQYNLYNEIMKMKMTNYMKIQWMTEKYRRMRKWSNEAANKMSVLRI